MARQSKEQKAITAAQVVQFKEDMPQVQVRLEDGSVVEGLTQGRKEAFCTVSVKLAGQYMQVGQWAWESIAGAYYSGRPVRV